MVAFPLSVYPFTCKEFFEILGIHGSHIVLFQWIDRGYRCSAIVLFLQNFSISQTGVKIICK